MAQVIYEHEPRSGIDHSIDRLLTFWRTAPEQAAEWPDWDEYSRLDFTIEWPIMRETLSRVSVAANAGLLDAGQRRKWTELCQLIDQNRAIVEEMLGGPA